MADEFCLKMPDFHVTFRDSLDAVNLRHGTDGFTSPPKEGELRIFFFALKNSTASVGFAPQNLSCNTSIIVTGSLMTIIYVFFVSFFKISARFILIVVYIYNNVSY